MWSALYMEPMRNCSVKNRSLFKGLRFFPVLISFFLFLLTGLLSDLNASSVNYKKLCKTYFKYYGVKDPAGSLGFSRQSIRKAGIIKNNLESAERAFLSSMASDTRVAKRLYRKFKLVEKKKAGPFILREVVKILDEEALRAITAHDILQNGTHPGRKGKKSRIVVFNNGLVKDITKRKFKRYMSSLIEKIHGWTRSLISKKNIGGGLFFEDYKFEQFKSSLTHSEIKELILNQIREQIIEELSLNKDIVNSFGGEDEIRKAVYKNYTCGTGRIHEGAVVASKIAATRNGRKGAIVNFSEAGLLRVLEKAKEVEKQIPDVFKKGGRLSFDVVMAFRRSSTQSLESIRYYLPVQEMKEALDSKALYRIKTVIELTNVLDYVPPSLMSLDTAMEILELTEKVDGKYSAKNLSKAVKLYKSKPLKVQSFLKEQLEGNGWKLILSFDLKGLGIDNYILTSYRSGSVMEEILNGNGKKKRLVSEEVRRLVNTTLHKSAYKIRKNVEIIEEVLESFSGLKYEIAVEGDDIYVLVNKYSVTGKIVDKIFERTDDLRASGVILNNKLSPGEVLVTLDYQQEKIVKELEKQGIHKTFVLMKNNKNFIIPPGGVDSEKFDAVLDTIQNQ